MISSLHWNPERIAFNVPYINRPVAWYGILFVLGFFLAYYLLCILLKKQIKKDEVQGVADKMLWYVMIGTVIGARLGHVFFYNWPIYRESPISILKVWEGGLASHGGVIGIIIALILVSRKIPQIQTLMLFDYVAILSPLVGGFIRIGNFMNQEILGLPTTLPWAVVFGSPADGSFPTPRHPAQLYEATGYLTLFCLLWILYRRFSTHLAPGFFTGLTLAVAFSLRILFEFFKQPMSDVINETYLLAGQTLSVPFILLGILLMVRALRLENKRKIS
ncbi:MAG: prolipoprotein diacylglyceryl transferase [Waddliaceae bacterium]